MNAAELRALGEALLQIVPKELEDVAEIIELLAWAEESGVKIERSDSFWWAKIECFIFSGHNLLDTLRRAREESKS